MSDAMKHPRDWNDDDHAEYSAGDMWALQSWNAMSSRQEREAAIRLEPGFQPKTHFELGAYMRWRTMQAHY